MPDALPVHWNLAGEADRFSGKAEGLLALPVIALVTYVVLLAAIGGVMGRMRPNAVMGVRTPWTLSSQAAWDASHRLGGWLFLAIGGLLTLGGLTGLRWLMVAGIVVLFVGSAALIWYGYWICRSDPNRLPKGQTLLTARSQQPGMRSQEGRGGRRQGPRRRRGRR